MTKFIVSNAAKIFLDTDILIQTLDSHDKKIRKKARDLLRSIIEEGTPVISTLVLQEFYQVATDKLQVNNLAAKDLMQRFSNIETVPISVETINKAIDISILSQMSFWDSLVFASAEQASCSVIYSTSINTKRKVSGIQVENPFAKSK